MLVKAKIQLVLETEMLKSCMAEFNRVGVYEGDIIEGKYNPKAKAVDFIAPGGESCMAWVGGPCEIIEEK